MLAEAVDVFGARKVAAAELQVSESALSRMLDADPEHSRHFPATLMDRLARADAGAAAVLAHHFAALADGRFVPVTPDASAAEAVAEGLAGAAGANAQIIAALADGHLDPDEARAALPQVREAAEALGRAAAALSRAAQPETAS